MTELKFRIAVDNRSFVVGIQEAEGQLGRFASGSDRAGIAAERLSGNIARVGHYAAGLVVFSQIGQYAGGLIKLADEFANLGGRLNLVTSSAQQATAVQRELFEVAQQTRTGLPSVSGLYVKLAQSTESLGLSQQRLIGLTRTIGQTMALSGGDVASMEAALMQLGQGMASGTLRGEELNSILEQAPALAQAIATGMGTTMGALRKLGEEGKLTAQTLVMALENSARSVESDFNKLPLTIGQAMTQVRNSLLQSVGVFDQANGLSRGLAEGVSLLSRSMDALVTAGVAVVAVVGVRIAQSLYGSAAALVAERSARIASMGATVQQTQAVAIHTGFVLADARATLASAQGFGASVVAQNAVVAASQRHAAALVAQTAAQTAFNRASSLAAGAAGLLGGPLGVITTLLGVGATAWAAWSSASAAAETQASTVVKQSTGEIITDLDKQIAKLRERNRLSQVAPEAARGEGPQVQRLAELQTQIDQLQTRTGQAAAMTEGVRQAVLAATLRQYGELYGRIQALNTEEQRTKDIASRPRLDAWMEKYADDAEKLQAELKKVREELGGVIPPDLEARIRAKFTKPMKEGVDHAKQYADLVADLTNSGSGLAANFNEQANVLARGYALTDKSTAAAERYRQAVEMLISKQPFAVEQAKAEADALKDRNKAVEDALKLHTAQIDQLNKSAESVGEQVRRLEDEAAAVAMAAAQNLTLAEAITRVEIARLREKQVAMMGNEDAVVAIEREIEARRRLGDALNDKAAREAGDELRKRETAEWAKTWEQVGQSFADNLMSGGKSASQYIKDLFRTMVLRPLMQPVMGAMTASLGLPGTASASGGAGGTGGMGSMMSSLSGLAGLGSAFKAGSALTMSGAGGTGLALEGAGSMIGSGSYAAGAAQGAGALAPWAMAAMAGGAIGRGISNGYGIGGKSGNGVVNTGMVVGAIVGGPLGAAIGGAIGGVVNRAFGRKLTETGIEGTLGGEAGFSGNAYTKEKGGWFRSDRTRTSALDAGTTSAFSGAVDTLRTQTRDYAAALGLGADSVGTYTQKIKLNLMGLSEADQTKAIDGALSDFANGLATSLGAGLDRVALRGEKAGDTLARLGGALTTVNDTLGLLGQAALAASLDGGAAADALLNAFGGAGNFDAKTSSYFANFYSESERTAAQTGQMAKALKNLGLPMQTTREGFRRLVEAQDLTTDSGRSNYAALMMLGDAFAEIVPATEAAAAATTTVVDALAAAGEGIIDFVNELRGVTGSSGSTAQKQAAYQADLAAAQKGDVDASKRVIASAKTLLDATKASAANPLEIARTSSRIAAQLSALPAAVAYAAQQAGAPAPAVPGAPAAEVPLPATPVAAPAPSASAASSAASTQATMDALLKEISSLRSDQASQAAQLAAYAGRTARILEAVTPNGTSFSVTVG